MKSMQPPESKHWHRAGEIEGQGVRQIRLGERALFVIELEDDVLVIDAACSTCGQTLDLQTSKTPTTFCSQCQNSQLISHDDKNQLIPTMLVGSEIYVLLVPEG
jgi:hypothetical protein